MTKENRKPSFSVSGNKGFQLTFENGYTISVQWGPMNYCEKRDYSPHAYDMPMKALVWQSKDAEVAAWRDKSAPWLKLGQGDDVIGHLTTNQVLTLMVKIAALPSDGSGDETFNAQVSEIIL